MAQELAIIQEFASGLVHNGEGRVNFAVDFGQSFGKARSGDRGRFGDF